MMMRTKRMEERIKARRFLKLFIRQSLVILKQEKASKDNIKAIIDLFDIQTQYNIQSQSPKENLSDKHTADLVQIWYGLQNLPYFGKEFEESVLWQEANMFRKKLDKK